MKKTIVPKIIGHYLKLFFCLIVFCIGFQKLNAQIINETFESVAWQTAAAATSNCTTTSGKVVVTATSASSTVTYFTVQGSSLTSTSTNTSPNSGTWWYSKMCTTSGTKMDKIRSKSTSASISNSGYIITPVTNGAFVSVTFWAAGTGTVVVGMNTNTNATQPTYSSNSSSFSAAAGFTFATQAFTSGINSSMTSYSYSGSFSGPARIGFFNTQGSIYIDDIVVSAPSGTAPVITTTSITAGQNTAQINASLTAGLPAPSMPILSYGVIWSTSNTGVDTSLTTKTKITPPGINTFPGSYTHTATGLTPGGTQYYGRAYVIALNGVVYYGAVLPFNTLAATVPALSTNVVTNIFSYKATSGGNTIDSGGVTITQKGVCWSTSPNPTVALTSKTTDGQWGTNFSSSIISLLPGTTYYVRAYAQNSVGVGYGNQVQFTTSAAVPVLSATPLSLAFGNVAYNSTAPSLSYLLSGYYLSPASGTVTITAPSGYDISTQSNTGFGSTASVNYTGNTFTNKTVYVKIKTTTYGTNNGSIVHTGGGTIPTNTDTVNVTGVIIQDPAVLTNSGTDFWLGFGYQEKMSKKSGDAGEARMSVYVTTLNQPATVHVELPSAGYNQTFTIPANSFHEFTNFPTGDASDATNTSNLPDARLFSTGISNKGVHVYSDNNTPVSVFLHTYTNANSAAGAMIFPTNTWNSSYTVQAYGGVSNNSNPNSFFFVVANEDNTVVTFTPTQPILNSASGSIFNSSATTPANTAYAAGGTYSVTLNKGQIFNAMGGFTTGDYGLDLSGSTVKTSCDKKIAVFGGNGRVLVNANVPNCTANSGSDHLIQQMFPTVAWGTRYLTNPTKTMEFNYFRIYVQDITTAVKVNGTTLASSTLVNNLYYQYSSNQPLLIESDKPINVSQFITASGCAQNNGSKGTGDPEMIILSPLQQAITNATVYSAPFKGTAATPQPVTPALANGTIGNCASFINVVIPNSGVASFKLDGLSVADTGTAAPAGICGTGSCTAFSASTILLPMAQAFRPHPQDANYSIAKFWVSTAVPHTLSSAIGFNAIAYGLGDGESYGYNAGTAIKNLTAVNIAQNPFGTDTSTSIIKTCVNNPVTLKIALPYLPYKVDSIVWNPGTNPVAPLGSVKGPISINNSNPSGFAATYNGTILVDGQTFYVYTCPVPYTFSQEGTFHLKATAYGTFISDCGSSSEKNIDVLVGHDNISFTATVGACGSTSVTFADNSQPLAGTTIAQHQWNFGDATNYTATAPNILPSPNPHVYPPLSSGVTSYWAKLKTINSVGCYSEDSVFIDLSFNLKAKFLASKDTICQGSSVTFTDQSTSNATAWYWDWNDGQKDTVYGTAPAAPISHTFTSSGTFNVKLFVKNANGCSSAVVDTNIVVIAKPVADFQTPAGICLGGSLQFTNLSTPTTGVTYLWNFNDPNATLTNPNTSTAQSPSHIYTSTGPFNVSLTVTLNHYGCTDSKTQTLSSTIYQLPTAAITSPPSACMKDTIQFSSASSLGGSGNTITDWYWDFGDGFTSTLQNPKHAYLSSGTKTVTLYIKSDKGCVSTTTSQPITIKPLPNVTYTAIPSVCANATAFNISQFHETSGLTGTWTYTGTGVSGTTFNPAVSGAGTFQIIGTYNATNGCKDADTATVTVNPLPTVAFTISTLNCEKSAITFTDNSTPNGGSSSGWIWDFGDLTANGSGSSTSHTYQNAGGYTVKLTVTNGNNCTASGSLPLTVRNRPFANFSLPAAVCLPSGAAQFNNLSTVADDANPSLSWNFGDPNNATGSSLPNPTHTYSSTGPFTIKLTVTSQYGCTKDSSKVLSNVYPEPVANFTATPTSVCLNDTVRFTNNSIGTAIKWKWDFDDGNTDTLANTKHRYANAGSYDVSYYHIDNHGCKSNTKIKTITVNDYPVVDAGNTQWVLQGESVKLLATATGTGLTFKWTPSTYLNYDTVLNPLSTPLADQPYLLTVTGTGGCSAWDTTRVMLLRTPIIPNAFSPNGDGNHDYWEITYLSNYAGCTIDVFDRSGQTVFSSVGYTKDWDGTRNGKPLPVGVYYYVINPKSGHRIMTGSVTILR